MWAGLGFSLAASVLLFPIGVLALPFVVAACWSLATRGPHGLEVLALGVGIAAFTGWIAVTADGSCGTSSANVVLAPGQSQSCGGVDGGPFAMFTGAVLVLVLVAAACSVARARRSSTD